MKSPAQAGLDNLRAARGPDNPLERLELRDEVRITALLLLAESMDRMVLALTATLESVDAVTQTLANTDQLTIHDLERHANGNGPGARPPGPPGGQDA